MLIDLSQVALVTGKVAPIRNRYIDKLGYVALSKYAKAKGDC